MAPRFISVAVEGRAPVEVRVVTHHPSDDALRRQLYRVESVWDWCDAQTKAVNGYWKRTGEGDDVWMPPSVTAAEVDKVAEMLATAKIKRDETCRELFKLVLGEKLSGEQIEELLQTCNIGTIVRIFEAAKGIDPLAVWSALQTPAAASVTPS